MEHDVKIWVQQTHQWILQKQKHILTRRYDWLQKNADMLVLAGLSFGQK